MKIQKITHLEGFYDRDESEELTGAVVLEIEYADGQVHGYLVRDVEKVTVHHYPEGLLSPETPPKETR